MILSSTVRGHKGSEKEICYIDVQVLNNGMMFYLFSSLNVDIDGEVLEFVFIHFTVHVLSSEKLFNSVLGSMRCNPINDNNLILSADPTRKPVCQ